MQNRFYIRKVAVLGAGVMGAQIAAHFGNAGITTILFDLKSKGSKSNELVEKALDSLKKLKPKPLAWSKSLDYITVANYDDSLELLKDCDLVIEAIAEKLDWKEDLYKKITPFIDEHAIIASNTSGLSIKSLSSCIPQNLQSRFCGVHFFNPPRYMSLIELIPYDKTDKHIITNLETFLVTNLGKNIIIAKDTPNFIANRIGVFSMLVACIHTEKFALPIEVVDKLTGKELGRAKSATFRTADVVGLDTFAHVVKTMADNCRDGFESCYKLLEWIKQLIDNGALGQKTKAGFYKKEKDEIKVIDLNTQEYRTADRKANPDVLAILRQKNWARIIEQLHDSNIPEAQFLWSSFRDIFHYSAVILEEITDSPRNIDLAIRWGFGWKEGIFEIWQQAGWSKVANWINEDIKNGKTLSSQALPNWVFNLQDGVYIDNKHFNIVENQLAIRHQLPVYDKQLFPDLVINEKPNTDVITIYENDGVRLWHTGDNIGILSFKTKMCAIGMDVLHGIEESIKIAESKCIAMVIWQEKEIFSAGANLEEFGFAIMMNGVDAVDQIIQKGHDIIVNRIRYSRIPIIAGVRGYTFGGGCEIMLHCDGVVAALESYIGLVEAGVGLLPGWGGTTEMAYRSSQSIEPWKDFERRYKNLAMAQVASSAYEALEMGFLRESDVIVMNTREVLFVAKEKARFMALSGYRPPLKPRFNVLGSQGIATVNGLLANMYCAGQISDHDMLIAKNIATTMCGGEVEKGTSVSEDWVLNIEKEKFKELAISQKTADRIQYMLENGKPLRN
ncbi:MAG: 3-hydroxyacyl-CoA dehydrogenase/enoyl-CoA hydratase family protein [Neisseriaceae bacterium]